MAPKDASTTKKSKTKTKTKLVTKKGLGEAEKLLEWYQNRCEWVLRQGDAQDQHLLLMKKQVEWIKKKKEAQARRESRKTASAQQEKSVQPPAPNTIS